MANSIHTGHSLFMRRRSTKTASLLPDFPPIRRNRSASDSAVLHRRKCNDANDQIDVSLEIRNLITLNVLHESCAICKVYLSENDDDRKWKFHSASEAVQCTSKTLSFQAVFSLKYTFGKSQLVKIEVCEFIRKMSQLPAGREATIGSVCFRLEELICAFGVRLKLSLITSDVGQSFNDICGTVIVSGRMPIRPQPVILQFAGHHLEKHEKFFDESTVLFQVHRIENDHSKQLLYQSESIANHAHPSWKSFSLQMGDIADNRNRLLEITALYNDEVDKTGIIGKFLTSYAKMKYGPGPENVYNVINSKKQSKKGYENSGKFELVKFNDVSFYSFLDYVTSGTQLHFAAAIDFSQPTEEGISQTTAEDRQQFDMDMQLALRSIGNVLRNYCPTNMFPAFGFGAKIPPAFHDSQEFCLNFETDPNCRGLDGIIDAYKKASRLVTPIANACYSHVIYYVAKMAQNVGAHGLHYYVLTIFTQGGHIVDLKQTVSALVYASKLPISVIFVGIGDGEFGEFHRLAYAGRRLSISGRQAERELVEFVELNAVIDRHDLVSTNRSRIAQQALHPIPDQLIAYMHRNNIAAKPPIEICGSTMMQTVPHRPPVATTNGYDWSNDEDSQPLANGNTDIDGVMRSRAGSERRCDDYECNMHLRGNANDGDDQFAPMMPGRSRSELPTTREAYQRRFAERMAAKNVVAGMKKLQIRATTPSGM